MDFQLHLIVLDNIFSILSNEILLKKLRIIGIKYFNSLLHNSWNNYSN